MTENWRQWIGKDVKDSCSEIEGKLDIEKREKDLVMDERAISHKEEVVVRYNRGKVYFGNANRFSQNYNINNQGEISHIN